MASDFSNLTGSYVASAERFVGAYSQTKIGIREREIKSCILHTLQVGSQQLLEAGLVQWPSLQDFPVQSMTPD